MKKLLMGMMGVALLASCGGGGVDNARMPTTNWKLETDVTNTVDGRTIKAGTYVVCDNANTIVVLPVSWTAGTDYFKFYARGERDGVVRNLGQYDITNTSVGGSSEISYTFGPGMAPLNLGTQSIVVNPIKTNVRVKGYTRLGVSSVNTSGLETTPDYSNYIFPVVDCI